MVGINVITSGSDFQVIGPNSGVDIDRAGNQVGTVLPAAVHAPALHGDIALTDVITGDLPVIELRLSGGQRGAIGVDKPTAVTGDARRVGNHHLGFFTRHFDIAI